MFVYISEQTPKFSLTKHSVIGFHNRSGKCLLRRRTGIALCPERVNCSVHAAWYAKMVIKQQLERNVGGSGCRL